MITSLYAEQARLLLRVLPFIMRQECFALKGGTAINFFVRDMPRLSVDIDLAFLPQLERGAAILEISRALREIAGRVKHNVPGTKAILSGKTDSPKILIQGAGVQVKIEPNLTLRGAVYGHEIRELVPSAQTMFETSVSVRSVSFADLYAGKLCAALDRQHPRDLFDIKLLLENEGITDEVRLAFVVYLASHSRPMAEILDPAFQPLQTTFNRDFIGMTRTAVTIEELEKTREQTVSLIRNTLTQAERKFLLSMKNGRPEWELLSIPNIDRLPALQWKIKNILRLRENKTKHRKSLEKLAGILNIGND